MRKNVLFNLFGVLLVIVAFALAILSPRVLEWVGGMTMVVVGILMFYSTITIEKKQDKESEDKRDA